MSAHPVWSPVSKSVNFDVYIPSDCARQLGIEGKTEFGPEHIAYLQGAADCGNLLAIEIIKAIRAVDGPINVWLEY